MDIFSISEVDWPPFFAQMLVGDAAPSLFTLPSRVRGWASGSHTQAEMHQGS